MAKVVTTVVANTKRGRKTNNSSSKRTKNDKTNISKDTRTNVVSEPSVVEKAVVTINGPETGLATTTKHPSPISYISDETTCSGVMKVQQYNASLSSATEIPASPWEKSFLYYEQWDMDKDWDDVVSYCTKTSTMDSTVNQLIGWSWELYAGDCGLEAGRHNGVLEFDDRDNDDNDKQTGFVDWLLS